MGQTQKPEMSDITEIESAELEPESADPLEAESPSEPAEPSAAAKAIAELSLIKMSLQELKKKSPADLLAFGEKLDIENANAMRKQDMMFAILKTLADEGV